MSLLSRMTVYPIKALSGVELETCMMTSAGALLNDRRFAIKDGQGRFVNGKRHAEVNQLFTSYDLEAGTVTFDINGFSDPQTFVLQAGNEALQTWLSEFFGFDVVLEENDTNGFPDDNKRSGPTIISTATLEEVASWFPNISVDEIRRRFRSNLELADCPAFWEDQLNQVADEGVAFQIGDIKFEGLKHSVRCPVPTQDTQTGEVTANFQKVFMQKREETLPSWIKKSEFGHYYRLAINTRITQFRAVELKLGDSLVIS